MSHNLPVYWNGCVNGAFPEKRRKVVACVNCAFFYLPVKLFQKLYSNLLVLLCERVNSYILLFVTCLSKQLYSLFCDKMCNVITVSMLYSFPGDFNKTVVYR